MVLKDTCIKKRMRQPDGAQVRPGNLVNNKEWEADYYDLKRSSTNMYGFATCGVPVKFK
jgi:hypothetical protein